MKDNLLGQYFILISIYLIIYLRSKLGNEIIKDTFIGFVLYRRDAVSLKTNCTVLK